MMDTPSWFHTVEYRSVTKNRLGGVDLEINHPDLGWIPYTIGDDECGLALSQRLADDGVVVSPYVAPPIQADAVNAERDRRTVAGFTFNGHVYDFDMRAKTNISGAAQMAFMAIVSGAQPGNLRWHGGDSDFTWIAQDNSIMTMDAQTVAAFGQTAARHETAHVMAARALKDMQPIPQDFTEDKYWP